MNIYVVIPTNRSVNFLSSWGSEFSNATILIIEDSSKKSISIPNVPCKKIIHISHEEIIKDVGVVDWIFPRHSAAVRSYGFYKAYQNGADMVVTLDDDCYFYEENFLDKHAENLSYTMPKHWFPTFPYPDHMYTRGFPYEVRDKMPVALSHGLWVGIPDFDGITQLKNPQYRTEILPSSRYPIPVGYYFPMSSMNIAFKREIVPLMYQALMGTDEDNVSWGFDRFDDIWCGVFAKKILDHLGLGVINGLPHVLHKRASNPHTNVLKESTGMKVNEELWTRVNNISLTKNTPNDCYRELNKKLDYPDHPYFVKLRKAINLWLHLFDEVK
jgi:hypothetical protein